MYRILLAIVFAWALLWGLSPAYADTCLSQSGVPTFQAGQAVPQVCDTHGTQKVMTVDADGNYVAGGGGGGGDASAANQTTIIARLDSILTAVGTTLAGYLDGVETLITSTNTKLDSVITGISTTLAGYLDGVETLIGTTNTSIGATSDSAVTTNTTGSLSGKLRGLVAIFADIWNDSANSIRVIMTDSSGNEIVIPTAGLTSYTAAGASTNATSVKGSAGTLYGLSLSNTTTTVYYVRLYNLSSSPTCNSATGYVESIPVPPAAAAGQVGGREMTFNIGKAFTTGIGFCITGGASSTDNTNAAAGVYVSALYK